MKLYQIFLQYPSIQTDSRKVKKGDLFFALKGPNFNGNAYAAEALEKGAAYAIVDERAYATSDRYILEEDALAALQHLARYHRLQLSIPVIAITGSNGKTTTKELLTAVLSRKYTTYATAGNLNNHIGVPLSLLRIGHDAEMAIIEMGANHLHEIEQYCGIAQPNFGLITNCGKAHLEGFGSLEGVRKGKGELYDYIRKTQGTIFRNTDLDYLEKMAAGIPEQKTYGRANAQTIGRSIGSDIFLNVALLSAGWEMEIQSRLVGDYNLPNLLAAVAVGRYFDIAPHQVKAAIEAYQPTNSRSQLLEQGSNKIILDAYNANPSSMQVALKNFKHMKGSTKWIILGEMKELGADSQKEHQAIVDLLQQLDFQNVLLCGEHYEGISGEYPWFADTKALAAAIQQYSIRNALVLVKGSRAAAMEQVLKALD